MFDVFATTALEAVGKTVPPNIDAVSLVPALRGGKLPADREMYFTRREGGTSYHGCSDEALIRNDWKLLRNTPFEPYQLYNLEQDPLETTNLAADQPDILREMAARLACHIQRGGATPWQPPANRPKQTGP